MENFIFCAVKAVNDGSLCQLSTFKNLGRNIRKSSFMEEEEHCPRGLNKEK